MELAVHQARNEPNAIAAVQMVAETDESERLDPLPRQLEIETGFPSYGSYLGSLGGGRLLREARGHGNTCSFFEISCPPDCPTILDYTGVTSSGAQVLERLNRVPPSIALHIVLWDSEASDSVALAFLDVLGLKLRLDPRVIQNFWNPMEPCPFQPTHMLAGGKVATISDYKSFGDRALHTVLIAHRCRDNPSSALFPESAGLNFPGLKHAYDEDISTLSSHGGKELPQPPKSNGKKFTSISWVMTYRTLLIELLDCSGKAPIDHGVLAFTALLPLLQIDAINTRWLCRRVLRETNHLTRASTDESTNEAISNVLVSIQRQIDLATEGRRGFIRFIKSQKGGVEWLQRDPYISVEEDSKAVVDRACRLESHFRHRLQLRAGDVGLHESRKSIELSSAQMEEGRKVKIFTVLAFVYVPLNLATSIFGMNLHQLNGSGQPLWTFFVTVVLALVITVVSWFFIEQTNNYRTWQEQITDRSARFESRDVRSVALQRPRSSLGTRLGILQWLIRNGYWSWAQESGVWWLILSNSPKTVHDKSVLGFFPKSIDEKYKNLAVVEYVSEAIKSPNGMSPQTSEAWNYGLFGQIPSRKKFPA